MPRLGHVLKETVYLFTCLKHLGHSYQQRVTRVISRFILELTAMSQKKIKAGSQICSLITLPQLLTVLGVIKANQTHRRTFKIIQVQQRQPITSETNNSMTLSLSAMPTQNVHWKSLTKEATGYDGIPPKIMKIGAAQLSSSLAILFNSCINNRKWPSQ